MYIEKKWIIVREKQDFENKNVKDHRNGLIRLIKTKWWFWGSIILLKF